MKIKSRKRKTKHRTRADHLRGRWLPSDRQTLLTGVSYAELLRGNRVRLVYTNGYKLSAVLSSAAIADLFVAEDSSFLDLVDAVEVAYVKRTLGKKLKDMADQLQILEMQKGPHYMMGSKLNQEYETWQEHYENITGHPWRYSLN